MKISDYNYFSILPKIKRMITMTLLWFWESVIRCSSPRERDIRQNRTQPTKDAPPEKKKSGGRKRVVLPMTQEPLHSHGFSRARDANGKSVCVIVTRVDASGPHETALSLSEWDREVNECVYMRAYTDVDFSSGTPETDPSGRKSN